MRGGNAELRERSRVRRGKKMQDKTGNGHEGAGRRFTQIHRIVLLGK